MMLYTIRYRCYRPTQETALIVEGRPGASYLLNEGHLHVRLRAPERG